MRHANPQVIRKETRRGRPNKSVGAIFAIALSREAQASGGAEQAHGAKDHKVFVATVVRKTCETPKDARKSGDREDAACLGVRKPGDRLKIGHKGLRNVGWSAIASAAAEPKNTWTKNEFLGVDEKLLNKCANP